MDIVGITAFDRPSAVCLVRDGRVIAGACEEIFSRRPRDRAFPRQALDYCLRAGKIASFQVGTVVWAGDPDTVAPRTPAYSALENRATSVATRVRRWLGGRETIREVTTRELDPATPVVGVAARIGDATAALATAPFRKAAGLVLGDDAIEPFTARDGLIRFLDSVSMPDTSGDAIPAAARDALARSGAGALVIGGNVGREGPPTTLAGALGVPVHCVPGGAAAAAVGVALAHAATLGEVPQGTTAVEPLGPSYTSSQIRTFLRARTTEAAELGRDDMIDRVAEALARGRTVGWFDGRVPFGDAVPGGRSVLRLVDEGAETRADETTVGRSDHPAELGSLLDALEGRGLPPRILVRPLARAGTPVACSPTDAWSVWIDGSELDDLRLGSFFLSRHAP